MSPAALGAELGVPVALVADVLTAIGRAGYPTDELTDSRLARALIVDNTRDGGSHSSAVLAGYRSRGLRPPADDGLTVRIEASGVTTVTRAGRVVGRVVERRQRVTFARLDDEDVAASCVLGRLRARVLPGGLVELTTDEGGVAVVPGVPTS